MKKKFCLVHWISQLSYKLGFSFRDPLMETSYQLFKSEVEGRILSVTNIMAILINVWNLLLGVFGSRTGLVFRSVLVSLTLIGALARCKVPNVSKAILLVTSSLLYYFIMSSFTKFADFCQAETFYLVGNHYAFVETIVLLTIKNLKVKVIASLVNQILKIVVLIDGVKLTIIGQTGMMVIWVMFFLYYETVERRYYQVIYESREQLKKFQDLLSNDFPSSVLIMSSDFSSILYSNHFFNNKFGGDHHQDFVLSIFEKFQVDSFTPSFGYEKPNPQTLYDFVKRLSSKKMIFPEKEVITLSTVFANTENSILHYEIKLRQISWDSRDSYALIFSDVSDKQLVMALKIADVHKDQVIATVSHELRTPINGILGLLGILTSKATDQFTLTYLGYCQSCSKLLLYLVNAILDLSQIRHSQLKIVKNSFRLDTFLEELKSLYLFQAQEKAIDLVIINRKAPNEIYTDKYRLIEILINLLGNAFKFTFKGKIELTVEKDNDNENMLIFSVSDTGVGIKEEDKPKLFTMFGKLHQEDKNINAHGVGLGLTIANELVKALNDFTFEKLEFDSEFGKGTRFYFKIPFQNENLNNPNSLELNSHDFDLSSSEEGKSPIGYQEHNRQQWSLNYRTMSMISQRISVRDTEKFDLLPMSTHPNNTSTCRNQKNIIIVDDNPFNLLAAAFLLEKLKFTVYKALSGDECIKLLKEKEHQFYDLVLMDIQMPIMDGLEACKIITTMIAKKELSPIPIIALSANENNEKNLKTYAQSGFIDYLTKPVKEEELKQVLRKWIPDIKYD